MNINLYSGLHFGWGSARNIYESSEGMCLATERWDDVGTYNKYVVIGQQRKSTKIWYMICFAAYIIYPYTLVWTYSGSKIVYN